MMKTILIATFAFAALSASAAKADWSGTRSVWTDPAPPATAQQMANHRAYMKNLRDAGMVKAVKQEDPTTWYSVGVGPVNTIPSHSPNHAKVPLAKSKVVENDSNTWPGRGVGPGNSIPSMRGY